MPADFFQKAVIFRSFVTGSGVLSHALFQSCVINTVCKPRKQSEIPEHPVGCFAERLTPQ